MRGIERVAQPLGTERRISARGPCGEGRFSSFVGNGIGDCGDQAMSVLRGVSLGALRNKPLSKRMVKYQVPLADGAKRAAITVKTKRLQLSLDAHVLDLTLEQPVLNGSDQAMVCDVESDGEIRGIHLDWLSVRFVVDLPSPATKRGRLTGFNEKAQAMDEKSMNLRNENS